MIRYLYLFLVTTAIILSGCAEKAPEPQERTLGVESVFNNGDAIPDRYTCMGEDLSPTLTLEGLSSDAVSVLIIVEDPDAPGGTFIHWIIWDIPPTDEIPEGIPHGERITSPFNAFQGKNDFGKYGYNGPCPPPGKPHRYVFRVYVLDTMLGEGHKKISDLMRSIKGHILQYGELEGIYGR